MNPLNKSSQFLFFTFTIIACYNPPYMGKPKSIKLSVADLIQKVETGEITLFGNQEQMEEQSLNALKRLRRGNPGKASQKLWHLV
jgi:hypothetical protein